jgi:hypothetical protein
VYNDKNSIEKDREKLINSFPLSFFDVFFLFLIKFFPLIKHKYQLFGHLFSKCNFYSFKYPFFDGLVERPRLFKIR